MGLDKVFYFGMDDAGAASDARRADEWEALHRRPDALPLPAEPARPGRIARLAAMVPVIRRVVVKRA